MSGSRFLHRALALASFMLLASVTAAGARWPVDSGETLLGFGATYERDGRTLVHRGIDVSAGVGETVLAPVDGEVTFAGLVPGDGGRIGVVTLRLDDGRLVSCSPLDGMTVVPGDPVAAGSVMGRAAGSGDGSSAEPHVHVSLRAGDLYLDPAPVLGEPPVPEGLPAIVAGEPGSGVDDGASEGGPGESAGSSAPGEVDLPGEAVAAPGGDICQAPAATPAGDSYERVAPDTVGSAQPVNTGSAEPGGRTCDAGSSRSFTGEAALGSGLRDASLTRMRLAPAGETRRAVRRISGREGRIAQALDTGSWVWRLAVALAGSGAIALVAARHRGSTDVRPSWDDVAAAAGR